MLGAPNDKYTNFIIFKTFKQKNHPFLDKITVFPIHSNVLFTG